MFTLCNINVVEEYHRMPEPDMLQNSMPRLLEMVQAFSSTVHRLLRV